MVDAIIKGDIVRHRDHIDYGIGQASHADDAGRWVIWRDRPNHWAAGLYKPSQLILVGPPEAKQQRLPI
jgi:hypothetical protein